MTCTCNLCNIKAERDAARVELEVVRKELQDRIESFTHMRAIIIDREEIVLARIAELEVANARAK